MTKTEGSKKRSNEKTARHMTSTNEINTNFYLLNSVNCNTEVCGGGGGLAKTLVVAKILFLFSQKDNVKAFAEYPLTFCSNIIKSIPH